MNTQIVCVELGDVYMRAIPIQNVEINSVLGEDLYTAEGKILLRKGTSLSKN